MAVYRVHSKRETTDRDRDGNPIVEVSLDIIHSCGISDDVAIYTGVRIRGSRNRVLSSVGGSCEPDPILGRNAGDFALPQNYLTNYQARRLK